MGFPIALPKILPSNEHSQLEPDLSLYSAIILKNSLCLFLQGFVNMVFPIRNFQMLLNIEKAGEQDSDQLFSQTIPGFYVSAVQLF